VSHTLRKDLGESVTVQVILDGTCVEIFVDGALSLTHRFYATSTHPIALFAENATVEFGGIALCRQVVGAE
jgi:hypothetical protein